MNRKKTEDLLFTFIQGSIFGISFVTFLFLLNTIRLDRNDVFTKIFESFTGAFLAFLFLRLSDFLTQVYRRQEKHFNSLVELQSQLNEIIGIIYDNLYLFPGILEAITTGNVSWNKIRLIPLDKSHYLRLFDTDLINTLFEFNLSVRKINDDVESFTSGYEILRNALIERNITQEHYQLNCKLLAPNLKHIAAAQKILLNELLKLFARIRIQTNKDAPLIMRLKTIVIPVSGKTITEKDIREEVELLKKEVEANVEKSKIEIDAIKNEALAK